MARPGRFAILLLASCAPAGTTDPGDAAAEAPQVDAPCTPGETRCDGDLAWSCRAAGSGWDTEFCDPVQGLWCDEAAGFCRGPCSRRSLGLSYIGCDYYPTVVGNGVISRFDFAVAVSNTTGSPATVTVDWGALDDSLVFEVSAGSMLTQKLPWHPELKGCMGEIGISCAGSRRLVSLLAPKGAYRLRSTQPVTVYQFNPLDYQIADGDVVWFSYTNDASLLLPANALGVDYRVAAWPATEIEGAVSPGLLAVTATEDHTSVTITTRTDVEAGGLSPAFEAGVPQTVTLQQGDALELFNFTGDLTGTRVEADRPVQVIGGHFCTFIPADRGWCDHLEESLFPVAALSNRYVVSPPAVPSIPDGKVNVVRIVAVEDDTALTYDPPRSAPTRLARAGDFVEIADTDETFVIGADRKILVAQYMEGQEVAGDTGDPAMALAVPTDQYRLGYLFHAPINYETNYVEVFAPAGSEVRLDGTPIGALTPIGESGLGHRRVVLGTGPRTDGNHEINADVPLGITVYGYGQYTSYWYPGGLDLAPILIE